MKFDEIGEWSEIKLEIIKEYACAYSTIMAAQKKKPFLKNLTCAYIDAFAGAGKHLSRTTGQYVKGSPANALNIHPPLDDYFFIDLDAQKASALKELSKDRSNVRVYEGDCNKLLLTEIFPKVKWDDFRRGLCLLDPYGLHLNWEVIRQAGRMKSIEIFLNFPVADMNRNVFWRNPQGVASDDMARMNSYWGDESWRSVVYDKDLFGGDIKSSDNPAIADAFRERLKKVASFSYVPQPIPMKNGQGAVVYYLFFASQNSTGGKIVKQIFEKYGGPDYKWR
ncbi:MAG: three-Cys-motif partner protein TcmP [Elusimicrobia bacterium]|nr:three-Cys-motif partner protein TcmP [Elusimicrobiota bacterium]